jgi:hypothetical protein
MLSLVTSRSSSPVRWPCEPCPGEPQLTPCAAAAAKDRKPLKSWIGCWALTTIPSGGPPSMAMCVKSLTGSNIVGLEIGATTCDAMPEITSE